MVKKVALFFFACAVVLAVWKSVPNDVDGLLGWAGEKAGQVKVWSDQTSDSIVEQAEQMPAPSSILPDAAPSGSPGVPPEGAGVPSVPPVAGSVPVGAPAAG